MKLGYVAFWVAISLLLFGCDQRPDNGVRICVNAKTHERVSSSECASDSNNALNLFMWYWILSNNTNYNVPPMGSSIEGYNYRAWSSQDNAMPAETRNNDTVTDNLSGEVTTDDAPASTGGEGAAPESSEPAASEDSGASSGGSGEAPEASSPSEDSGSSSGGGESEDSGGSSGGSGGGGEE